MAKAKIFRCLHCEKDIPEKETDKHSADTGHKNYRLMSELKDEKSIEENSEE